MALLIAGERPHEQQQKTLRKKLDGQMMRVVRSLLTMQIRCIQAAVNKGASVNFSRPLSIAHNENGWAWEVVGPTM